MTVSDKGRPVASNSTNAHIVFGLHRNHPLGVGDEGWAADLVHGGAAVDRPGSTRWSQVTHFFGEGCVYVTPQRSRRDLGRYAVRDPLMNVATGRPEPQPPAGWAFVRTPDRLTQVVPEGSSGPATVPALAASTALGLLRRAKWHAAALRDRVRP